MRIPISAHRCVGLRNCSNSSSCGSNLVFLFFVVTIVSICYDKLLFANAVINPRHGGTHRSKSFAERHLAGTLEAVRWITEPFWKPTCQRPSTTVTVANVGFGRTGTTSLEAAVKILGLTPLQDDVVWEISDLFAGYYKNQITMGEFVDRIGRERGFDYIYIYDVEFYKWLATSTSAKDIKVILTVRDSPEVWAESFLAIADFVPAFFHPPFVWLPLVQDLLAALTAAEQYHTNFAPRELHKDIPTLEAAYQHHVETIQSIIPSDRLLIFNVKDGWGPLCAFLLSDSNTNVNSMINRRVSLFYRYPLKVFHHMVCPCTLYGVCVMCPGTSELVGQHPPPISISASENGDCQP